MLDCAAGQGRAANPTLASGRACGGKGERARGWAPATSPDPDAEQGSDQVGVAAERIVSESFHRKPGRLVSLAEIIE
jgi:hypothetical protein